MAGVLYMIIIACAAVVSVRTRAIQIWRAYEAAKDGSNVEPRPSYLSKAIEETLACAAGIYIGLSAVVSFLKLSVPPVSMPGGFSMDPVPALAIFLALVQPLFGRC